MNFTRLRLSLSTFLLCIGLLTSGLPVAHAAPQPEKTQSPTFRPHEGRLQRPAAPTQTLYITGGGFSPATLDVFGPTDIAWENRSGVTVTLRSGVPSNPGTDIYLPIVVNSDGAHARTTAAQVRTADINFSVTLGPRDTFVQRYSAPGTYSFHLTEPPQAAAANLEGELTVSGTGLLATSPQDGEDGVAVTRETILTFSAPLNPSTVTKDRFVATVAGKALDYRLHISDDRRQVTLFFADPLPGDAQIEVRIDGETLRDAEGGQVDVDGDNVAGGVGVLTFSTLSLTTIPGTSVCGRVFASTLAPNGTSSVNQPLQDVTITVDGREQGLRTVTDGGGNFCLDPAPAGRFFVHIDGRTAGNATPQGGYYPFVGKAWQSIAGEESSVGDIYLPLVQPGALQPVSETEDVNIGFAPLVLDEYPEFADVAITVPAGSLFFDDGRPGDKVGIAPVPPDRLPGQLPEGLQFPLVITVQTDGATNFDTPAPICFPNLPNPDSGETLKPGEKTALWSFNHDTGRFGVVGPMTANADASLICTDPGVGVPAPGWHSWNPGVPTRGGPSRPTRPPLGPPPPPPEEEEECEPGKKTCEQKTGPVRPPNGCGPQALIDTTGDLSIYNNPVLVYLPVNALVGTGCDFRPSCNGHDLGYAQCEASKPNVDTTFLADMRAACASCYSAANLPGLTACQAAAQGLYEAVSNAGQRFYDTAQEEACECEECPSGLAGAAVASPWKLYDGSLEAGELNTDEVLTGLTHYMAVNLDTGQVQRGEAGSNGIAFEQDIILAPRSRYRIFLLHAETLYEDYMDVVTPNSGENLELPPFYVYENLGYDLDGDGLGALGEEIMGTDPAKADSDGDGMLDGAEVQAGGNPLSGVIVKTGIIGSADTPGTAVDVCVNGDVAAVADKEMGVALFNVFAGLNPQIVAQVDTPGSADAVACDGDLVAVADGPAGLAVLDISDPSTTAITHQVGFDGAAAWSVAVANGIAYVGLADGRVARVDMDSGTVVQTIQLLPSSPSSSEIQDLILLGDFLHAITEEKIYSVYLSGPSGLTPVTDLSFSSTFGDAQPRQRLAGGDNTIFAAHDQGAPIYDVAFPIKLQDVSDLNQTIFGWRHIVPSGSGLAVAASAPAPDSPPDQFRVSLYDVRDPSQPGFLSEYETPGMPTAIAIAKGLAYVADSDAGVQVINYQAADTAGITPTVTLASNFSPGRFQPGAEMRLTAIAQDDVQIRDVEFYLNRELLQQDAGYPFEIRFTAPDDPTITLRAKATDTGGNVAWTEWQTRNSAGDAIVPEVLAFAPARDEGMSQEKLAVQATFSEAMDATTLTPATFKILNGADEAAGGGAVDYNAATRTATLTFSTPPAPGQYQAVLTSAITDQAGNPLPDRAWRFNVTETLSGSFVTPSDDPGVSFGQALAMDGDWMAVGAPQATVGANNEQGAVYLFTRDSSTPSGWREVKRLTASDGATGDQFGRAVAVSSDTVIVGAPSKELTSRDMGQVYVFSRDQGGANNWGEVTRFADAVGRSRYFGSEVEIVGDTFVAIPTTVLKTAYVYRRSGAGATDWSLLKEVTLDDSFGQNFGAGEAVALSGDERLLIASVPRLSIDANDLNEGVVRIFEQDAAGANNWGQTGELQASDAAENAYFGGDIALHGDVLVVGSPFYDTSQEMNATGKLYIFVRDGAAVQGWREVAVFSEPETLSRVRTLGSVVGAGPDLVIATGNSDIYAYRPAAGNPEQWSRVSLLRADDESSVSFFNGIIATDGSVIATGATAAETSETALFMIEP